MIESIVFQSGRSSDSDSKLKVDLTPMTVFVGPNNSGKSKVLSEIASFCIGDHHESSLILDRLNLQSFTEEESQGVLKRIALSPIENGEILIKGPNSTDVSQWLSTSALLELIQNHANHECDYCRNIVRPQTAVLDGPNRIALVNDQPGGDLHHPPRSSFQVLLRDLAKRNQVRRITYESLGFYLILDPTNLGLLRLRMSNRAPETELEEIGIHKKAVEFHSIAQPILFASDGVKAFTGMITEIVAGEPHILIIDEPEAFLHPSLASKLGYEISQAGQSSEKRIFVSTHSPAFVMGCVHSGTPINIIRLTYRNGVATSRLLPSTKILQLMRNPLLRSTGVLSALFYEFVIVTESDSDRAFYEEINERLLRFKPDGGIPNCLFLNAQNKQTVQTIIKPLRELGIPTAGVVDVDILKDGGKPWTALLQSANVPELAHSSLANSRAAIKEAMVSTGRDMKRDGGIQILSSSDQEAAHDLLAQLANYGIFVVPGGELESWLKSLGATRHGTPWLIDMFERLGDDPSSGTYQKPMENDVWQFVKCIRDWLIDPDRKGIPS